MSFRLVRANVADIVGVEYFSVGSHIFLFNEEDGHCAVDAFRGEAVVSYSEFQEAYPFICI